MKNLTSPKFVKEIIKKHGFYFSKGLGQNFLIDSNILDKILEGANLNPEDGVLEIGPGIGTMTQALSRRVEKVIAIEIDKNLLPILKETLEDCPNIEIVYGDILKLPLEEILNDHFNNKRIKVVANLPYYITTPIIMNLLEKELPIESITIMVQKEVAERMYASPGGKDYGALSVAVQFYSNPSIITNVPPTVFMPPPNVGSTIIRLDVLEQPKVEVNDRRLFFSIVAAAFGKRRKTLLNALSTGNLGLEKEFIKKVLNNIGISEKRRGETLSLEEFARISNNIK
ncbi:MAG TPA: 16S rRNA (adenine(1518)-N(6)/adenine(1519)-N(6))-dimethyltransferase RsmA [Eubacteriaceae bacterium]|nr:16S rRNA (adenine(1518)-N(6)/adenine(1519)-N(6))-dimethyltransferase RsmA [Eubacteriaceae bacterium]